jgi:hypothetical protein
MSVAVIISNACLNMEEMPFALQVGLTVAKMSVCDHGREFSHIGAFALCCALKKGGDPSNWSCPRHAQ